jgi:Domain of unknown function (DUF4411)
VIYIFDTSPLSTLFRNYYRPQFPSLWAKFEALVDNGQILSVREVLKEIEESSLEDLRNWAADHQEIFTTPTAQEGAFVARIFAVPHFQQNIEQQKILKGGNHADAFLIAKAFVVQGTVVTMEGIRPHAVKIPNICQYFEVPCMSLQEFMVQEKWVF